MHIDAVLESLGESGYYPYVPYVFMCFTVVCRAWHILAMTFLGMTPKFHCAYNESLVSDHRPLTDESEITKIDGTTDYDAKCYLFDETANSSVLCNSVESGDIEFYNSTATSRSIMEEWDFSCEDAEVFWIFTYSDLGKTFYVLGALVGYIFVAPQGDRFGRKPVTLLCTWIMGLSGLCSLFVHHIAGFYAIRFIGGICYAGTGVVWAWTAEIFSQKSRTTPVVLLDIAYAIGVMTMAGIAYAIPYWRYLYMTLSIASLLTIPLWWLCPESIKWLYSAGREVEGRKILEKLAKQKNVKLPDSIETELPPKEGSDEKPLMKMTETKDVAGGAKKWTTAVILVTLFMAFIRATTSMYYYGLSFNTNAFSGSKHLNFFLFGSIEIPAILLVVFLLKVAGRRFNVFLFLCMSGGALFILAIARLSTEKIEDMTSLRLGLNLFGKFSITGAYAVIDTYGAEVFPTEVRASTYGIAGAASRLSSLASTLAEPVLSKYPLAAELIFGLTAIFAAFMVLYCPETKGRPIPQRAADLDVLKANTPFCFFSKPTTEDVETDEKQYTEDAL